MRILFLLLLLAAGCERQMIYFPTRASEQALRKQAAAIGMEPWADSLERLVGWRSGAPAAGEAAANRVVVLHGNAGYALHRTYYRDGLCGVDGGRTWEVYLLEYPGYGARPGSPGQKSLTQAARDAIAQLVSDDDRPIYLLGESIGSGVACAMAAESPERVAGLILVTPFTTLGDVGAHHYPLLPARLVLRRCYDNRAALRDYRAPVAFLLAGRDEIIPARLGRELHDGYGGPKRLWVQEAASHNTLEFEPSSPWWEAVSAFLTE